MREQEEGSMWGQGAATFSWNVKNVIASVIKMVNNPIYLQLKLPKGSRLLL